ncbi:hypothetical protein KC19_VG102600 [Ceratodon purpureus]|uniref:Uncharacterized protein n=1 Tax=Ceratodon purpureus TaxID=3225 RepID=A0A8T0HP00_CERPU|nr:hypothetical protein KC19_VG102600 [Ceratodon purpureus]
MCTLLESPSSITSAPCFAQSVLSSAVKRVNLADMSPLYPNNVEEVRLWLRRVQLFEEVNWEMELPSYSAIVHLTNDDFVFDWTLLCGRQYEAVAQLTGVVHITKEDLLPDYVQEPLLLHRSVSDGVTVGRPPLVLGSDSESNTASTSETDRSSADECWDLECPLHGPNWDFTL